MATVLENLITARKNVAAEIAAIDEEKAGGLPNVLKSDGGTDSDHQGYVEKLHQRLEWLNARIKEETEIQAQISGSGNAWEIDVRGMP